MEDVNITVSIIMGHSTVPVTLDITLALMDSPVSVRGDETVYKLTSLTNTISIMCVDVVECEDNRGGCQQRCINEIGSFHCDCFNGYALGNDMVICNGKFILILHLYTACLLG